MQQQTVSTAVLIWVPIAAALIGAAAGLGGSLLVTLQQNRGSRRARLQSAYANVMTAAHDAELHLSRKQRATVALPPALQRDLASALAHASLLCPRDTGEALDDWAGRLLRGDVADEYAANDVEPNVARWERAVGLMRRDLKTKA